MSAEPIQDRFEFPAVRPLRHLSEQHKGVLELLKSGKRYSSLELCLALGLHAATRIDSRVRDLKKAEYGAWPIDDATRDDDGVYRYAMRRPQ